MNMFDPWDAPNSLAHLKPAQREMAIQRYCTCIWATVHNDPENSRVMTHFDRYCKLHSPHSKFDLPEVFP